MPNATKGFLGNGTVFGNALVDMYAKCGAFPQAKQEVSELLFRDVIAWNALLSTWTCEASTP